MSEPIARRTSLAVMNQKGGVGKTTTAVNLGAGLAEMGHRVLLVDVDPQAHLTLHVGLDPEQVRPTAYDVLLDDETSAEAATRDVAEGLTVLPSDVHLAGAESEAATRPDRQVLLQRKLRALAGRFDYLLVDCPPSLGLLTINALATVGEVLVPLQTHFMALQGLGKLLETVQLVRDHIHPTLRVRGVVLCLYEAQTNLAAEVHADIEQFLEEHRGSETPWSDAVLFHPPVRRNIRLAEAPSFGRTVFQYAPACLGAADYRRVAEDLAARDTAAVADDPGHSPSADAADAASATSPLTVGRDERTTGSGG